MVMGVFWQTVKKYTPWKLFKGVQARFSSHCTPECEKVDCPCPPGDLVIVQLADLHIHVRRQKPVEVASEITVVVPRVEIRRQYTRPDGCAGEEEYIYNSVTVVHAPRHPEEGRYPLLPDTEQEEMGDVCPDPGQAVIKRQ